MSNTLYAPIVEPMWYLCELVMLGLHHDMGKHVVRSNFLHVRVPNITNFEGKRIVCKKNSMLMLSIVSWI